MSKPAGILLILGLLAARASAQFSLPSIPDLPIDLPDLSSFLEEDPVITTSLDDAVYEAPEMDGFEPGSFTPIYDMPHTSDGVFYLLPGAYELEARSYCLHAGTFMESARGDGYVYAPLRGSGAEIIDAILDRSFDHPEISQEQVQTLIWAILARTKISEMDSEMRDVANALLTSQERSRVDGGALGLVSEELREEAMDQLPESVRSVFEAEAGIRSLLTGTGASYEELRGVAVLSGEPPDDCWERDIPAGRWSLHPDGYYIRYLPVPYEQTRIEFWIPEQSGGSSVALACAGKSAKAPQVLLLARRGGSGFILPVIPQNGVATPSNTVLQRLAVATGKSPEEAGESMQRIRNAMSGFSTFTDATGGFLEWLASGVPSWIFGQTLDMVIDSWAGAINALGSDPPRYDFTEYAVPEPLSVEHLAAGPEISSARATAINDLMDASVELMASLEAAQVSLDRFGGAIERGDDTWAGEQALCFIYYKHMAGILMEETATALDNLLDVAYEESVPDRYITESELAAYQNGIRSDGFPRSRVEAAHEMGITDDQLDGYIEVRLSFTADEMEYGLYQEGRDCVEFMRECSGTWQGMPEVEPYWLQ